MKKYFGDIKTLLIIVLGVIIFLMRSCQGGSDIVEPQVITKIETRWDTVEVERVKYVPKVVDRVVVDIETIREPIDTTAILRDYYAKYFYSDTLSLDSLGHIVLNDTVTRNLIFSRDVQTNLVIPTKIITNTNYIYKREFFGGGSVGIGDGTIRSINGELLYIDKKRRTYGVGIGVDNNFQPIFTGRMYWKIGK